MEIILSLDPGKNKTGIALLDSEGNVIFKKIIDSSLLKDEIKHIVEQHRPSKILIGGGTFSKYTKNSIADIANNIPLILVEERHSTEQAKIRYFKENPPRGLWKFIPIGLQVPPEAYDDYAAIIIAENYLKKNKKDLQS